MKDDKIFLLHILEAIEKIEKFVKDVDYDDFLENDLVQSAVIRQIEIIGEAASKLSSNLRKKYSEIPWQDIIGMRHKLIHGYFGVDVDVVWETIKKDVPKLKKDVERILKSLK